MALRGNALTKLDTVKDLLGISGSSEDTLVERLINAVSQELEDECGRLFGVATQVTEKYPGYGDPVLILDRAPILAVDSVEVDGDSVDVGDWEVEDADAGFLRRLDAPWAWTARRGGDIARDRRSGQEDRTIAVQYSGGWLLPQNGESQVAKMTGHPQLDFDSSGKTITRDAGDWTAEGFADSQTIYIRGATKNAGAFTVDGAPTATVLTVSESLTDESDVDGVVVQTAPALPTDIEEGVIQEVVSRYRSKARDSRVASEKVLSQSVSYHSPESTGGGYTPDFHRLIRRYMRHRW